MRNFVAKNDYNRASVHTDQKKAWEPDVLDGLEEHFLEIENPKEDDEELDPPTIALAEYSRGVKASGIV
ncbi:hypothetical protein [Salmonella phage NINP13076]|uniref:Uncharacterized protein n=1 Tax=Salmonella phage SalP219 TaxID=3158864 RepID=A0AAU7PI37_9CAUD|nr:hypothetical protein [Salmonella phage NINP13076]